MLNTLLKKQMMEVHTWLIQDKKSGKLRSKRGILFYVLLYVILFGFVGAIFFATAQSLCEPLCKMELGWLYYVIMSFLAVVMGVFGSVFNTSATLYGAKDNELLLSMPVKPLYIVIVRICGVYLWSFIYTALVFIPTLIVYMIFASFSLPILVCGILMLLVLSAFVLVLSCVLGWVVEKITVKLKKKSFATVLLSLILIAIYYFIYFKAMELIQDLLANAMTIGANIKGNVLFVYWLGQAATGDFGVLLFLIITMVLLLILTIYVMSCTFIKMATTNKGDRKKIYKHDKVKCKSVDSALLIKECRRLTSSANYMMNCSLGTLFLPILGVAAIIKMKWIRELIVTMDISESIVLLIVCAGFCSLVSLNDITSPSVSLEGKNLWLVQSLPVSPWQVLKAKLKLHLWVTEIPVAFGSLCVCIAIGFGTLNTILCLILPMIFAVVMAELGLVLNLKLPNLTWTNEIVPIKQSASVISTLFGGWMLVGIFAGVYFWLGRLLQTELFIIICAAILISFCLSLLVWLKNKGSRIFADL